jgi:chitodextrinase
MAVRSTAFAASVLVLAFVFVSAAPAKRPPPPPPPPPNDQQAPTTPTNLRITASSATSISLAWNPSTDNSTNWWYCVQTNGAGCFRVDPPQTTSAVYPTRISVSWTASVDNTSQVFYTLFVNGRPYSETIGSRDATVLYLSPSTTYELKVTARDRYGNTAESNVLSVATPAKTDDIPPTAPANLRFSSETAPPEAWLNWDQSTDETDPQSQILYEVYLNGERFDDGGDRVRRDDHVLPCGGPDRDRAQGGRHIRKRVGAEQRAALFLLGRMVNDDRLRRCAPLHRTGAYARPRTAQAKAVSVKGASGSRCRQRSRSADSSVSPRVCAYAPAGPTPSVNGPHQSSKLSYSTDAESSTSSMRRSPAASNNSER